MAIDISLPLAKYSFAMGCDAKTNTIPWEHLTAVDLFVVIKGDSSYDASGSLSLKIIYGTKVLEKIDIDRYIERAMATKTAIQRQGTSARIEQLPIFGITSNNLLALRYRLQDGQDHRTQLRMQSAADCRQIVDLFQWRGMEFKEASARPGTSRTAGRPSTAQSDFRPLTAESSSPYFSKGPATQVRPSTTQGPALGSGSPLRQAHRPESLPHDEGSRASPASEDMPPPRVIRRGENKVASNELAIERPSSAQMWRTRTAPNQPSGVSGAAAQYGQAGPTTARPSSYNNVENMGAIRQAVEEDMDANDTLPPTLQQQDSSGALELQHHMSHSSEVPLPLTAASASSFTLPDTQDIKIAMEHELHSAVPRSRHSGSSSRPSSALDLPPLKKPQVEKRSSTSLMDQTTTPHETWATSTSVQKRPVSSADTSFYTADEQFEPRKMIFSKKTQISTAPQVSPQVAPPSPISSLSAGTTLSMDELVKQSRGNRLKESAMRRQDSTVDAPHELESPPPSRQIINARTRVPSSPAAASREGDHSSRYAASKSRNNAPAQFPSLDDFAAQRPEDRAAAMDEWIIANLENPSFTTLCEDLENCWRRIALGL